MKSKLRQRRCKSCGKAYRAERRTTCSLECQAKFAQANADRQKEAHNRRMVERIKFLSEGGSLTQKPKTLQQAIELHGHDEDFIPVPCAAFLPTDAPAGSPEKIEVLRRRVELGQPLWHNDDRNDYVGLVGAVRPIDRTPRRVSERNATRMMYSVGRKGLSE